MINLDDLGGLSPCDLSAERDRDASRVRAAIQDGSGIEARGMRVLAVLAEAIENGASIGDLRSILGAPHDSLDI